MASNADVKKKNAMLASATIAVEPAIATVDRPSSKTAGRMGGRLNAVLRQWPRPGAVHERVDVPVQVVVRRAGPGRPEEPGDHQEAETPEVHGDAARGDVPGGGHEQQEGVDAELHQMDIVRDDGQRERLRALISQRS